MAWIKQKISVLRLEVIKQFYPLGCWVQMQFQGGKPMRFWFDKKTDNGFILGFYEEKLRLTLQNLIKDSMVFYDLGAHWGYFSLVGSKCVGSKGFVYSFEPLPENYERLVSNLKTNNLKNVNCYNLAISNQNGTALFSNDDDSFANTYINSEAKSSTISVETINLDDFVFSKKNLAPNIIKIDVEGAEYDVLCGAKKLLEEYKPILHLSTHELHNKGVDRLCKDLLIKYGYTINEVAKNKNGLIVDYVCT